MSTHLDVTLDGVTKTYDIKMPSSLDDFLRHIRSTHTGTPSETLDKVKSSEYLHGYDDDGYDEFEPVYTAADFDEFVRFALGEAGTVVVELIVDPGVAQQIKEATPAQEGKEAGPDETNELLEKVKKALEEDHSLAGKLKEVVHEVCGPHPPDHHRGHGERGRGRGRGRGSHRGGGRRPPFEHGPFHPPRHSHDHRNDDDEGPHPPFPPFDHPPSPSPPYHGPFPHFHSSAHHAFPPLPRSSWNVDRMIYETWTPTFPSPASHFGHPPPPHYHQHRHEPLHQRPGRGRFPRHYPASHPGFEREVTTHEFPPFGPPPHAHFHYSPRPPLERVPSHGDHHQAIPGEFPGREHSQACCPPPRAPSDHHRAHEASGAEDWEVEFEELSVR